MMHIELTIYSYYVEIDLVFKFSSRIELDYFYFYILFEPLF